MPGPTASSRFDLHAGQIQGFFDIPTDNLFAAPVMERDIKARMELGKLMVVSPDVGGVVRARALAKRIDAPLAIVDKRRERAGESEVMNVIGDVSGRTCILIDDIIDLGGTLVNAAEALLERGAKDVLPISPMACSRRRGGAHRFFEAARTGDHRFDHADGSRSRGAEHPCDLDRTADRRGHRPHGLGRKRVQPVQLRRMARQDRYCRLPTIHAQTTGSAFLTLSQHRHR